MDNNVSHPGIRILEIRKALDLSRVEFANKIGLKKAIIGHWENGTRNIPDSTLKLICNVYNVEYNYIAYGTGPIFSSVPNIILTELAHEYSLDQNDIMVISSYIKLSSNERTVVKNFLKEITKNFF